MTYCSRNREKMAEKPVNRHFIEGCRKKQTTREKKLSKKTQNMDTAY